MAQVEGDHSPSFSSRTSHSSRATWPVTPGDRAVVYRPELGSVETATPRATAPPAGVPERAEAVSGVGFTGWRWIVEQPDASTLEVLHGWQGAVVPQAVVQAVAEYGPLLVFDVDSTLIRQEVIELLAAHASREEEVTAVTEAAMRGELDFADSLHHRVRALANLDVSVIDEVVERVEFQPGAVDLIRAVNQAGGAACAVSGGFSQVLAPLAQQAGLWHHRANELEVVDGVLTGKVVGEVVDRTVKRRSLEAWAQQRGVPREAVVAIGDGANDIDMLQAAGYAVAFCAKPALRPHADCELDVPTLDVIRVLLGQ